jgi:hypothetical protein
VDVVAGSPLALAGAAGRPYATRHLGGWVTGNRRGSGKPGAFTVWRCDLYRREVIPPTTTGY